MGNGVRQRQGDYQGFSTRTKAIAASNGLEFTDGGFGLGDRQNPEVKNLGKRSPGLLTAARYLFHQERYSKVKEEEKTRNTSRNVSNQKTDLVIPNVVESNILADSVTMIGNVPVYLGWSVRMPSFA